MQGIIDLCAEINEAQALLIGGKGLGLHRLFNAGAAIPRTICIPESMELEPAVESALSYFGDSTEEREYAVRSSASIEDGMVKSCAGQFESFLRIKGRAGLMEYIGRIRRLKADDRERIEGYAGKGFENLSMHVLVQEMVPAEFAGVLFTCDPVSGSRSHLVVEMVPGTAEALLSGTVMGERFMLHRDDTGEGRAPALTSHSSLIASLAREALHLEERLRGEFGDIPLDFEWAFCNGRITWLQARPVTAAGRASGAEIVFIQKGEIPSSGEGDVHWTSLNAREAIPSVLTPLVGNILLPYLQQGFLSFARLFGDATEHTTGGIFDGRLFLNVTALKQITGHFPLKNPGAMIESFLSGRSTEKPSFKVDLQFVRLIGPLVWKNLFLEKSFDIYIQEKLDAWKYPDDRELKTMGVHELKARIVDLPNLGDGFPLHLMGSMRYMNVYSLLEDLCAPHGADPSVFALGAGTPLFASAAEHLRDLACILKDRKEGLFDGQGSLKADWKEILNGNDTLNEFRSAFDKYIDRFGHLGDGSLDFYRKNYREEPERVLMLLGSLLQAGEVLSRKEYLQKLTAERAAAVAKLRGKLSFPGTLWLDFLAALMLRSAPLRENIKFVHCRKAADTKIYVLELARRAVECAIIGAEDDIFFLTLKELMALEIPGSKESYEDRIRKRRLVFQKCLSLPCPLHRLEGPGGTRLYFPQREEGCVSFKGAGASAGRVVGKARIILSLAEAGRLRPGEILVTTTTEPSWTPLFSLASAIVVEIGSLLSHGAVVAREIGIPAVLGVPGIVEAIRDGDLLSVDGAEGTVEVLERA